MRSLVALGALALLLAAGFPTAHAAGPHRHDIDIALRMGPAGSGFGPNPWDPEGDLIWFSGWEPEDAPRVFLGATESLRALQLTLDSTEALSPGAEAVLRVDCDPNGPVACGVVAEAHGPLPLTLAASHLSTPDGALLRLYVFTRGNLDLPVVGQYLERGRDATLRGWLETHQGPSHEAPTVTVPVDFHGDSGCREVRGCIYPHGDYLVVGPLPAPLTAIRLTATWTAESTGAETQTLEIRCLRPPNRTPCDDWPRNEVTGTSPLTIDLAGLTTTSDSQYEVVFWNGDVGEPTMEIPIAVPQAYHLTGEYSYLDVA